MLEVEVGDFIQQEARSVARSTKLSAEESCEEALEEDAVASAVTIVIKDIPKLRSRNIDTVQEFATHDGTIEVDADVVVKASSLCYNEVAIIGFYAAMNTRFVEVEHRNAIDADIAIDFTIEVKLAWQATNYFRCAAKIAVVRLATRFITRKSLLYNR